MLQATLWVCGVCLTDRRLDGDDVPMKEAAWVGAERRGAVGKQYF